MQLKQMTWHGKHLRDMTRAELMGALAECINVLDAQFSVDWRVVRLRQAADLRRRKEDA